MNLIYRNVNVNNTEKVHQLLLSFGCYSFSVYEFPY